MPLRAVRLASARVHKRLATTLAEARARGSVGFEFASRVTANHVANRLGPCPAGEVGEFHPQPPAIPGTFASPQLAGGRGLLPHVANMVRSHLRQPARPRKTQRRRASAGGEPARRPPMLPNTPPARSARQGATRGLRALPAAQPKLATSPSRAAPARQGGRPKFPTPRHHAASRMGRWLVVALCAGHGWPAGRRTWREVATRSGDLAVEVAGPGAPTPRTPHGRWARPKPSTRARLLACHFARRRAPVGHLVRILLLVSHPGSSRPHPTSSTWMGRRRKGGRRAEIRAHRHGVLLGMRPETCCHRRSARPMTLGQRPAAAPAQHAHGLPRHLYLPGPAARIGRGAWLDRRCPPSLWRG